MSYLTHPLIENLRDSHIWDITHVNDVISEPGSIEGDFDAIFRRELFRKSQDLPIDANRAGDALDLFLSTERTNVTRNALYKQISSQVFGDQRNSTLVSIYRKWKTLIRAIIGDEPNYSNIVPHITTGSTIDHKRGSHFAYHIQDRALRSADVEAWLYKHELDSSDPWINIDPRRSTYVDNVAHLSTIPKTWKIDRVIMKSIRQKVAYQCALGKNIRSRLLKYGLDLDNGQEWHRATAKMSSYNGFYDTTDLSCASDTVVFESIRLLPVKWQEAIIATRDTHALIKGAGVFGGDELHELQMLGGMGCGWTFELESLLFLTLTLATASHVGFLDKLPIASIPYGFSAFGDDLITPHEVTPAIHKVFTAFGFMINAEKSFSTGRFRESCGGDFYNMLNVRGLNLGQLPRAQSEYIRVANGVFRVCYTNNNNCWRSDSYRDLWLRIISNIHKPIFGPNYYGDVVTHTDNADQYSFKTNKWGRSLITALIPYYDKDDCVTLNSLIKKKLHLSSAAQMYAVIHPSSRGLGEPDTVNLLRLETEEEQALRLRDIPNKVVPLPNAVEKSRFIRIPFGYNPLPFTEGDIGSLWDEMNAWGPDHPASSICRPRVVVANRIRQDMAKKEVILGTLVPTLQALKNKLVKIASDKHNEFEKLVSEAYPDYNLML